MAGSSCRSVGLGVPGETLLILPTGHKTPRWVSLHHLFHIISPNFAARLPAVGHPGVEQVHVLMERTSTCVPEGWRGKWVRSGFGSQIKLSVVFSPSELLPKMQQSTYGKS